MPWFSDMSNDGIKMESTCEICCFLRTCCIFLVFPVFRWEFIGFVTENLMHNRLSMTSALIRQITNIYPKSWK